MKKFFLTGIAILILQFGFGQVPDGYYDGATGAGFTLKTQLYNIINDHTVRTYTNLWTDFQSTDKKTNGYVWDMYSDIPEGTPDYDYTFVTDQCGTYSGEGDCYNREHSFPKSWFDDASPMYSELFHLYPTDGYVNGKRSNYPFGEVGSVSWTSTNGSKLGTCNYPGYAGTVFEPIDEYKGDFARTYFYMATRYENIISGWENNDSNGDAVLNGTSDQVYEDWYLNMIIEWHNNDPVSQKELDRNNAIYAIQHNRNPFIDHPEYVAKIWGGVILNSPPVISNVITNPSNPRSTDAVNISASITDSDGTVTNSIIRWGLASGSLTNTINLNITSGSTYVTVSTIPAQSDGTTVYYKLEATDDSSDLTTTSEYHYAVNDNLYNIDILNENFTSCPPSGWLAYSVTSNKNWTCASGYESINAYQGDVASDDWLISPVINLNDYQNEILTFSSWTKYTDTYYPTVKLKYSTNYSGSGDPSIAVWTELFAVWSAENSQTWTSSGNIDLSEITGNTVYFAFQYTSSGIGSNSSSQWEIDSVIIVGDDITTNANPEISEISKSPESPTEGQSVTVSAKIIDSDGTISSSKIKWGTSSGSYPNTVDMTNSLDVYSGVISSQIANTVVYFLIEAKDNDNSISTSLEQNYTVLEILNTAPVISDILIDPTNPTEEDSIIVSATIIDSDGTISSARIKYGTSAGIYPNNISMSSSDNLYSGKIPKQAAGNIYFVIEATDDDSDVTETDEQNFIVSEAPNKNPVISNVLFLPSNPGENEAVSVSADISDSDGTISAAKIVWGLTSNTYPNEINMSENSGSFSGTIPGQIGGTRVYFKISATDNETASTQTIEYSYSANTPGNENPVISELEFIPAIPTSSESVVVSARITDSDGTISTANIKWGTTTGIYGNTISMSANGDVYTGTISAQANSTHIYFIVEANDNSGGSITTTEENYIVIDPINELPQITDVDFLPTIPTSSESVIVSATITDSDGTISTANIKWGTTSGIYGNAISMSANGDLYTGTISAQANSTHIYFIVEANDNSGGSTTTTEENYIVTNPINELPQITDVDFLPTIPTSSESVIVSATITDSDGTISTASIKWGTTTGIYGNTVSMSANENVYSGTIPAQTNGSHLYFVVEANDNLAGSAVTTEMDYVVTDPANVPPVILDVQFSPSNPSNLDSVLISANVSDSDGTITSVLLKWKRGSEVPVYEREMLLSESTFKAYIPAQEAGKTIYFMIVATDNDNGEDTYMDGTYSVSTSSSSGIQVDLNNIQLFPNPVKDKLTIKIPSFNSKTEIVLYNILGDEILKETTQNYTGEHIIYFSDKQNGLYFLNISINGKSITKKIIVN